MAHKVHPKIYRTRKLEDWSSRWYHKNPGLFLEEDFKMRSFLEQKLKKVGIEKIEIERSLNKIIIIIFSSRPGIIVGRGGEGIEIIKKDINKILYKVATDNKIKEKDKRELKIEVREVKNPWTSASLTAQWMALQLEKRVGFRRVLKQALSKVCVNKEIQGARVEASGRLDGKEMCRREWLQKGKMPRQNLRANIDYAQAIAKTTYGVIGIKVWLYKGEKFE
ncbi:MAG: 30S ribosomal protein S3 [Candidatus Pacebacteria bacterium]|nr:30S ribosomal protein S3 [Candidatus Paceibacterota bacterium]